MFVCMLVSGVRSSCEASATNRRCVSSDSSSAPSIVLNALAEARELIAAADGHALARLAGLRDSLRGCSEATDRDERRAGNECASCRAGCKPAREDEEQDQLEPVQRALDVVGRTHELEGESGAMLPLPSITRAPTV